ncbi:thioredoxin-dependent thiol peroxidase [Nesterenkonia sp. LB17]|uniref:thioredoxin-dependent thiol peroxidase n=1 Tax=unclassified Nesterenkonia TaxID=2629769 RepID=UPI001F4D14C9|nr:MULTISPECIES: thioredoxin-dependent thiol peroxidase [unclassified Nesterenkonia]MCH8561171.1 thioredoxin-dependent thiol peroxidase [Nesterenkonia sp. DZ6]MCH8562527.1 thioredoxin-dependent thiol peroxidase [Nesterenkonia sp. YGD6]MCH8565452.1 thioredoxin-dependent thiol peroxidase [Nesterenkonia sp. LB17]MCH8571363.1 thioredoxin-dependent thiol peroxidase [Nesterenkonia sp. AY15]
MSIRLETGDVAPSFILPAAGGDSVSLDQLRGQKVILYFYPKASTPGCTTQACDFRDSLDSLAASGYTVLGISPDPVSALDKFTDEQCLSFPLLADEDHAVAESYGAWGEKKNYGRVIEGLIRSTIVLDEDGKVTLAQYNVKATGHVARLREKLAA